MSAPPAFIKKPAQAIRNLRRRWCGRQDLNLHGHPQDPKSCASANSATPADKHMIAYAFVKVNLLGSHIVRNTKHFECGSAGFCTEN